MKEPLTKEMFLHRDNYRKRRVMDAVRLLPILGIILWGIPHFWSGENTEQTSTVILYIFSVWCGLAVVSFMLSRHLSGVDISVTAEVDEITYRAE